MNRVWVILVSFRQQDRAQNNSSDDGSDKISHVFIELGSCYKGPGRLLDYLGLATYRHTTSRATKEREKNHPPM
jgi:hypothetical protein